MKAEPRHDGQMPDIPIQALKYKQFVKFTCAYWQCCVPLPVVASHSWGDFQEITFEAFKLDNCTVCEIVSDSFSM